ncbi:ATP-binding protein [Streptomyces mirabilis]
MSEWESVLDGLATGVALVGGDGAIRWVNRAGARVLCRPREELVGVAAPFRLESSDAQGLAASWDPGESLCVWQAGSRDPRWLAYTRGADVRIGVEGALISFRDVTEYQQRLRSAAALARTAASMASDSSLEEVLGAMAAEIQRSPGVAGTQIITFGMFGDHLQLMGSAGFAEVTPFFDLLMASQDRGADLITHRSMSERRQQVLPGRRIQMLADPAWQPLHEYVSQLDWEDFVSTPLLSRGKALGALNVYVASGYQATPALLGFLGAMVEQAALAVDYATLIGQERVSARREERRRLARDLHDSVVQHVFSIGMQAKALRGIAGRMDGPLAERVETVAGEVTGLVDYVQRDLRGVVLALQPSVPARLGLLPALNALAEGIERRYDVIVELTVDALVAKDVEGADLSEDVYQIISEALHNAVKHAAPTVVRVDARLDERRVLWIDVVDDGRGVPADVTAGSGFGLTSMRDRASRWGGSVTVTTTEEGSGTRVRAKLPLPYGRTTHRQEGTT